MKEIQMQVINDMLKDKLNKGIISPSEEAVEKQRLMSLIENDVSTKFVEQVEAVDAVSMASNMETIGIDIRTAFGVIDDLDKTVIRHKKLNQASMANMSLSLKKAEDAISAMEEKKRQLYGSSVYKETFRGQESFETDVAYYKERYGDQQAIESMCAFDKFNEEIHLPYSIQSNVVLGKDGVSFATARIVMQLGQDLTVQSSDPNSMLDSSMLTSWTEVIQTNEPMAIELDENYYGLSFGAACEIEITMESATVINEIALSPYSIFPFELIAIRYTETASEDEPLKEIMVAGEDRIILDKPMSVRFKDQICKRIRILINQINYTNSNNYFDIDTEEKKRLFDESLAEAYSASNGDINPAFYERMKVQNKAWAMLSEATKGKDLNLDTLIGSKKRKVNINKFTYSYGFNNVSCFFNDFRKLGIYVSKPIVSDGPIWKVSLNTEEEHSLLNDRIYSDIEYYITTDGDGSDSEWMPIMPQNKERVESELLFFDENEVAELRFKVTNASTIMIYQNGLALIPVFDFTINENRITLKQKKPNAIYTASYVPDEESKVIEFDVTEFNGKDRVEVSGSTGMISNVVIPGSTSLVFVDNTGARYEESKGEIECVTNQLTPGQSFMNFSSSKLQYYTNGSKIYFNREISGNVDIQYKYQNRQVRLKAIFRKNIDNQNWIVPVLKEYKLNFISI